MTVYKTSSAGAKLLIKNLLTQIIIEGKEGEFALSHMPDDNNPIWKGMKPATIKETDDDLIDLDDPENWELACGNPSVGGRHSFHGDRMYPCGPNSKEYMNIDDGPFLGHGAPNAEDLETAEKYISDFKPDELVAYSRGGAIAVQTNAKAGEYTFLAPAWDRDTYGAKSDGITGISGKVYHGAGDRFVPVSHSCRGAKNSGLDLYVHPTAGHGTILKHYKQDSMGDYKKVPSTILDKCADPKSKLPDWGGTERIGKGSEELKMQKKWFQDELFKERKEIIRKIVEQVLLEKKGPGRPKGSKNKKTTYTTQKGKSPSKGSEGKNCAAGNRWAREKYKKPSMYRSMAAAKYCKNKNKKNEADESLEEILERVVYEVAGAQAKWRNQNWQTKDNESCGTASKTKSGKSRATKRCYPKKKMNSMTDAEKAADNAKKTAGSRSGKRVVQGTKTAKKRKSSK